MSLDQVNGKAEEEETSFDTVLVASSYPVTVAANGTHDEPEETLLEEPEKRYVLETPEERRGRRISHLVLYTTSFNVCVGFSIVLTGVWPYLRQLDPGLSKDMLGWVIAANPIGQMIASPLLGIWSNWAGSNRSAFIITMALFSLGNLLYAILNVFGSAALAVMITSRLIVGFSSGNIVIIRSYISASTTLKERTTAVSLTSAAQAVGFIVGPAIQTALAVAMSEDTSEATNSTTVIVTEEMEEAVVDSTSIQWNMYTATGWISCVLGLLNLLLFLPCIYKEYNIAAKEAQYQKRAANIEASKLPKPDYVSLFVILVTFSFTVMIYVLLETLMVPMCMDLYAWNDERAVMLVGSGLSIAAVICVLTFVLLSFTSKVIDERIILLVGVAAQMLAMIILIPMGSTYPKIKNCTSIDPLTPRKQDRIPHPRAQAPITTQKRAFDCAYLKTALLRISAMQTPPIAESINKPPFLNFTSAYPTIQPKTKETPNIIQRTYCSVFLLIKNWKLITAAAKTVAITPEINKATNSSLYPKINKKKPKTIRIEPKII